MQFESGFLKNTLDGTGKSEASGFDRAPRENLLY